MSRLAVLTTAALLALALPAAAQLTPEMVEAKKRRDAEVQRLRRELEDPKRGQAVQAPPTDKSPATPPEKPLPRQLEPVPLDPRVAFRTMEAVMQQAGCELCGQMALIPAGSFVIGSAKVERGHQENEGSPPEPIRVRPFEIGRSEVSQAQWRAVMGGNPSRNAGCDACPVERISWEDITGPAGFLARLNRLTGGNYRLPSEAEWEYATRAGSTTAYWWGNQFENRYANADTKTVPPSKGFVNAFGLAHTSGNVAEWVQDCYAESYAQVPDDGRALDNDAGCSRRVTRGGSGYLFPSRLRSASRFWYAPAVRDGRNLGLGFRLARTL